MMNDINQIVEILRGGSPGITSSEIARKIGVANSRTVCKIIRELRESGSPIVSRGGKYWIGTQEEVRAFCKHEYHAKAMKLLATERAMMHKRPSWFWLVLFLAAIPAALIIAFQPVAQPIPQPLASSPTLTYTSIVAMTPTTTPIVPTPTITPTVTKTLLWWQLAYPTNTPRPISTLVTGTNNDNDPYNGYWDGNALSDNWNNGTVGGYWIPGIPTWETMFLRMPNISLGSAVTYSPGVMSSTIKVNGFSVDGTLPPGYVGAVALPFWSETGHSVWIKRPGHDEWEGPFLVADCSRRIDVYRQLVFQDQVVEVDFPTGLRWGMWEKIWSDDKQTWKARLVDGRLDNVIVSKTPPNEDGIVKGFWPVDLSEWFLENVQYTPNEQNPPLYRKFPNFALPAWKIGDAWVIYP